MLRRIPAQTWTSPTKVTHIIQLKYFWEGLNRYLDMAKSYAEHSPDQDSSITIESSPRGLRTFVTCCGKSSGWRIFGVSTDACDTQYLRITQEDAHILSLVRGKMDWHLDVVLDRGYVKVYGLDTVEVPTI